MAEIIGPVPADLFDLGNRGRWFEDLRREMNALAVTGGVDHLLLANIGTNSHAQIDTALATALSHRSDATIHFTEASIDHTAISNIGTNTHAQIDTAITASTSHIADGTIHYTMLDEDDLSTDSATQAATQQSIKAYITTNSNIIAIETVTAASDTLDTANFVVLGDCTSNAITLNLPAVSGNSGLTYFIKKIDSTINAITVDGSGSETIDGATTAVINNQYETIRIVCNGTNWSII